MHWIDTRRLRSRSGSIARRASDGSTGGCVDAHDWADAASSTHDDRETSRRRGPRRAVGDSSARIGSYRIIERIGEGAFGDVYEAEQESPIRRRVALKTLKPGMDTRAVLARFRAERQALALMDHPHIAHVLDAGETTAGHPYFVMEPIGGEPITRYSASGANRLAPRRAARQARACLRATSEVRRRQARAGARLRAVHATLGTEHERTRGAVEMLIAVCAAAGDAEGAQAWRRV